MDIETWIHGTWRHRHETRKHREIERWRHGKYGEIEKWRLGNTAWRHGHGDMDMETWTRRHGHGDMDTETWTRRHGMEAWNFKSKTEAQAIFLILFIVRFIMQTEVCHLSF
jgi:hypothetical protein